MNNKQLQIIFSIKHTKIPIKYIFKKNKQTTIWNSISFHTFAS